MSSSVVLGIDFGGTKVACAVADLDGTRLADLRFEPAADDPAEATFERGIAAAQALLADTAPGHRLAAVGACTFGIPREDGIDLAPNIAGWGELPFGRRMREAFPGVDVRTATDVKSAARAEVMTGALRGADPGLYVNLGTGLAVALVAGSVVVTGRHGAAGEIGYNLRRAADAADAIRLEEVVSGKALSSAALRLVGDAGGAGIAALLTGAEPEWAEVRDGFLSELSFHLANLTIALDPERIAVGGGLVRCWDQLGPRLAAALRAAVPYPPDLVLGAYPFDAALVGALDLAREAALDAALVPTVPSDTREALIEGAHA